MIHKCLRHISSNRGCQMSNSQQLEQASRFLMQATLGANKGLIDDVASAGIEPWLNAQLAINYDSSDSFKAKTDDIWQFFRVKFKAKFPLSGSGGINGDGNNPALPYKFYFRMAWWHKTLSKGRDNSSDLEINKKNMVRHRIAQALSEILVISDNSTLEKNSVAIGDFYDILYKHAFGNYSDLLSEVSLHPCMGVYLTHLNNRKAEPSRNIHPDENYAREVMQLFSIGLFELHMDGSRKTNLAGKDIPTYDNSDIQTLARVFTGLRGASYQYEWATESPSFFPYQGDAIEVDDSISKTFKTIPFINMTEEMSIDEDFHDRAEKRFLNNSIQLPANQNGKAEIQQAITALVKNSNTAPFICKKLIQQLVTSNPSKKYIRDVALKFGEKGNLAEVVKAILLHPEAQTPEKLKSPTLRLTQLLRAFNCTNDSQKLWLHGERLQEMTNQHPVSSPTVFNFYKPDFAPHGDISNANKVAPEFELHNSATSIGYVNLMYEWIFGNSLPDVTTSIGSSPFAPQFDHGTLSAVTANKLKLDLSYEKGLAAAKQYDQLIDHISLLLTSKTDLPIKNQIKKAYASFSFNDEWVVQTIIFMIVISPYYTVLEA